MTKAAINRQNTQLPSLIPRSTLFGNPQITSPQLSPDGEDLAYIAPDENNVLQVWLRTLDSTDDRQLTSDRKRGIRSFVWTYTPKQLIYLQDSDGDENFHLYLVDLESNITRDLTPFLGVKARIIALNPQFPAEILVKLNLNSPYVFDVYRINLENGAVELDTKNRGDIIGWTANTQFQILAALATTADGGYDLLFRETTSQPWSTLRHWQADEQGRAVGFSQDDRTLYIIGSYNANAQRLIALDLATKEETVIAEDSQYDIDNVIIHPTQRHIQAVSFYKDKLEWQVLDEEITADFEALARVRSGELDLISRDLKDQNWIVAYKTDDGPTCYYLYERSSKTSSLLFKDRPELEDLPLTTMQPISYQARDGLTIHGYLSQPKNVEPPFPTVILVHGGPWARDNWGYDSRVQWLNNRGYAVLQPNFRGSTGYGKAFLNAGNRQWAAAMHDDLIDGVNWLVEQGIGDRSKIGIMGASYGGYATLVGLTFTPDVFACGIDLVGPSNIVTLYKSIPPYWKPIMAIWQYRVGDLATEEEFLQSISPLFFVDKIKKPLLIGQGANDPRVKQAESEQIVEALREAGKSVQYVLYTDEGHGLARPENRLHFYALAEKFLAQHLGGRCEAAGEIKGHSGIIK